MHTILLLYRSVVLAAATIDDSVGSDGGEGENRGGGGAGGRETSLGVAIHVTTCGDHTLAVGGVQTHGTKNADADTAGSTSPNLLQARRSVSGDIEWVAAQERADIEAAAAAAAEQGNDTASDAGMERGGDLMSEFHDGFMGGAGAKDFTPEQSHSAQEIAGQLDTEVRQGMKICPLSLSG